MTSPRSTRNSTAAAAQPSVPIDPEVAHLSDECLRAFLLKGDPLFSKHAGDQKLKEIVDFGDFMAPRLEEMMADFPDDYVPLAVDSRETTNRRAKENYKQTYITDDDKIMRFLLGSGGKSQVSSDGVDRAAPKRKLEEEVEEVAVNRRSSRKKEVPQPPPSTSSPSTSGLGLSGSRYPRRSKN